jgi:hypothetical protein
MQVLWLLSLLFQIIRKGVMLENMVSGITKPESTKIFARSKEDPYALRHHRQQCGRTGRG